MFDIWLGVKPSLHFIDKSPVVILNIYAKGHVVIEASLVYFHTNFNNVGKCKDEVHLNERYGNGND